MRIKQSVCPGLIPGDMSMDDFCKLASDIGYHGIEVGRPGEEFGDTAETLRSHGMKVVRIAAHASLQDGLNDYENHDRIEAELEESIHLAVEWDIPVLLCFSGNRNEGQSDEEGMIACARCLRRVVPLAEEKGVNLCVELLNSKVNHPGYQCDHTDWGLALCELVNSPRIKLLYDIYHMQIMEGDVIRNIRKAIDRIGHFHTAGNPGRRDMDDTQELNYTGICRAIAETSYDLYVGHEFGPKADTVEALRAAFELCDVE